MYSIIPSYFCSSFCLCGLCISLWVKLAHFFMVQLQLSPFPPTTLPCPTHPHLLHSVLPLHWCCPWVLYTCSLMTLPLHSPVIPLPPPCWLLSVCSLFHCLGYNFTCLCVWLIRFHLHVRLCGTCLSLLGLFHLTQSFLYKESCFLQKVAVFLLHSQFKCLSFLSLADCRGQTSSAILNHSGESGHSLM